MATRRHSRRGTRQAEEGDAAASGTRRSSRRAPAQADEEAAASSTRRSSRRAPAQEESGQGRGSSARMESASGSRRTGRHDKSSGSRRAPGMSDRELEKKAKKQKQLLMKIGVFAGIIVVALIIYSMIPNPNLPMADSKLGKAKDLLEQFEKAMEDKATGEAKALALEIGAILKTPLFANGINDPQMYNDPGFSDIYYATEAQNVLETVQEGMDKIPDIENGKMAKLYRDGLVARIDNIKMEENIEDLKRALADYRRNPINPGGDPDPVAISKYTRFIESLNARNKDVVEEEERRAALDAAAAAKEAEARAKAEAERKAKEEEERKAKIAAARETAEAEREAVANAGKPKEDLPKGKDYSSMSNDQLYREVKTLAKELKFNQARTVMGKMKESEGYDLAGKQAELKKEIEVLFGNARQEMSESFNDARQLQRANMVADARKSIDMAVKKLDALLANCEEGEIKKELEELKPLYDRMYNTIMN